MYIDISMDLDEGGFEAFVVSKEEENYKNYLEDFVLMKSIYLLLIIWIFKTYCINKSLG